MPSPPRSLFLALAMSLCACDRPAEPALFRLLPAERTGISFANTITTNDTFNILTDVYVYNGAGVGVGDFDNDGLVDLFFAGNQVSSRLYRNLGDFRFEDVTGRAGVATTRWATGVSTVDLNGDGHLDVYVSVSGHERTPAADRANLLFINDGDGTFTESAARYGIADTGYTTHAAFLDYDGDADLDLFLLTNSPADFARGGVSRHPSAMQNATPGSYNQLYRNEGNGRFTNVSERAGILRTPGFGLGVVVADLNRDGWPDLYVSNDGTPNDALYVNNGDGTFTDRAGRWLKHASYAGMGVDVADVNDDGWPDILQVDMMPAALAERKRMSGFMTFSTFVESQARGFRHDYSVNTLQLSNGVTPRGDVVFSEIARMAGVAHTGWSWSALFADFDNDGRRDIFISNGYPKAVNDFDYQTAMLASRRARDTIAFQRTRLAVLDSLRAYEIANHVFRNRGDLTFDDRTAAWRLDQPSLSYGAAYADLDNDGRLDLVVSNIDAPAFVYRNVGAATADSAQGLMLRLESATPHLRGIGAKIAVTAGGRTQYAEHTPYRGFMSSTDERIHFGLGAARVADSVVVTWPDGRRQRLTNVAANRIHVVRQTDAAPAPAANGVVAAGATAATTADAPPHTRRNRFEPLDAGRLFPYLHRVGQFLDYSVQPLLPYMISRQGPAIAAADVNGDGLDDVYVGGSSGTPGQLYLQQRDGRFVASPDAGQPFATDRAHDDWGALFFDANGDSLPDLYVASGAYHVPPESRLLQDRLYINRGAGRFVRDSAALPPMLTSTAAVRAGDFDGDGRLDLFVGGRLTPRAWPFPTRSYLLRNAGGRFEDVTESLAPALVQPGGLVTDAAWLDFDGDRRLDLVVAGEWMPVTFLRNEGARFADVTAATGLPALRGWWYSLATGDFDADGRVDVVAGNLGLNHTYTTSRASRFGVYAGDLTGNRTTDVLFTQEERGVEVPFAGLVPLGREVYTIGLKFPRYEAFSRASIREVLDPAQLQRTQRFQADTFASLFFRNDGGGRFSTAALPSLAQIAPIRALVVHDVDGDGRLDVVTAGNLYDVEANTPRADAGNGLWLRNTGEDRSTGSPFTAVPAITSGFLAPGNAAGLALVNTREGKALIVANTGDSLQVIAIRR